MKMELMSSSLRTIHGFIDFFLKKNYYRIVELINT